MNAENLLGFKDGRGIFSFEIKISENRRQDAETGYLYCYDAVFGHTGVQEYYAHELKLENKMANEIVKVHRFAEDVFSDSAMASIRGKSVTKFHPTVAVTKDNFKDLEVGTILDVRKDGDNVVGDIVIKDADAIMDILEGRTSSLSLGYRAKLIPINDNEFKQTELYINHLALVTKGRAVNARIVDSDPQIKKKGNKKMGLFDFLKGKKLRLNEDETLTILDSDDKEVETVKAENEDVKEEKEKVEDTSHEEVAKETAVQDTEENKEKEKEENDEMNAEQIQALKDELRAEIKAEFEAQLQDKVVVKDSIEVKVIETQDTTPQAQVLKLDFDKDEKLRKVFWDKYTNPMAHGGDFKALNAFRKKANDTLVQ